jgi:hypothetical protein
MTTLKYYGTQSFKNYLLLFGNPGFLEDLNRCFESHLRLGCIFEFFIFVLPSAGSGFARGIQ